MKLYYLTPPQKITEIFIFDCELILEQSSLDVILRSVTPAKCTVAIGMGNHQSRRACVQFHLPPFFRVLPGWPVSLRCTPVVSVISMATVQTASKGMSILEVRNNCPEDWEDWEGIWRNLWLRFKAAVAHLQVLPPPSFSMLWGNVTTNGPSSEPVVPRGGSTFVDR